ncbi:LysR family transcriptional regulator [Pseudoalteromonas sp. JBTF-M23]|uniref:LysR family transcriptional regulator n=1 Tax=Pseudoalteromonas caenipelagi TaxID=2726988 RepID=A0A849VD93_9GAMM|nr:LysR family transcriptional regulator [Pseudoalteromonas caenipelagi]NOU49717.1 LysR family transcriptional regulator [Pseudoalteromonas caenipelagi]
MQNWDDFQLLLALKQANTVRGAAKLLAVNHGTVSRRLANLNQRYGVDVCTLIQNNLVFSEVGLRLIDAAQAMQVRFNEHQIAIDDSVKQLKQQVTLSLPPAILQFVLMDVLAEFQQQNPHVQLNINTTYALSDLDKSEADVVIRAAEQLDDYLVGHRLCPISLGFFAHKDYFAQRSGQDVSWISINAHPRPQWLHDSPFPNAPIKLTIEDLVLRHQAAAQGLGMIRGAHYIAQHFDGLVEFAPSVTSYACLWVLTHPSKQSLPNVKKLITFLRDAMRSKQHLINNVSC